MNLPKYYQVAVASQRPTKADTFTYHYTGNLNSGRLVRVSFGRTNYNGVIIGSSNQPRFVTKTLETLDQPILPQHLIKLALWISDYYCTSLSVVMQAILPSGSHKKRQNKDDSPKIIDRPHTIKPLTLEQKTAIHQLKNTKKPVLLHGVTGSGKTRVYQEIALQTLKKDQSVMVLVPEITLTPQMIAEFQNIYDKSKVIAWHSGLTQRQRHQTWIKIVTSDKPLVVIGARSAIFAPLKNLGLIIIDECHENSYKQDSAPRYDTIMAASQLAKLCKAQLILGSATPSVTTYTFAKLKKWPVITLSHPVFKQNKTIEVIDATNRENFSNNRYFSDQLIDSIKKALEKNEQSLIFYNRRGSARVLQCTNCGWTADCPNCHLPMVLHQDQHRLRCHLCGLSAQIPIRCLNCSHMDLRFLGYGTKRLESELTKLFGGAMIKRFDADNLKDETLMAHYQSVLDGKVDILVGTQILAKGLDLPKLSVLGVVNADAGLQLPDVFAAERTFQLLYQSIGRIGRHGHPSTAIIQTFQPNNPAILSATEQNFQQFYNHELSERQAAFYPPRCFLLKITASYSSAESAQIKLKNFAADLRSKYADLALVGPAPAFHQHVGKKYRSQLLVKSTSRPVLQQIAKNLPSNWLFDLDPLSLL
jgi:primosomal protein N' (replication factor Y)